MIRSLAEYYHWEETGRGIRIYMHAAMVDRMQAEVSRGAASGPDHGKETGGILLGRVEGGRGKTSLFIDDFVAVASAHRDGPQYNLSGEETVQLEAALLRAALAECESPAGPSVLGYYRSHIREGLALSPADLLLIDSYFQAPDSVFLLVKAVANTKACTAGFFFWEDGRIQSEFSSLEVALGRTGDLPGLAEPSNLDFADDLPSDLTQLFAEAASPEPPEAVPPEPARSPAQPAAIPASAPKPPVQPLARVAEAAAPAPPSGTPRIWPAHLLRAATIVLAAAALVISVVTYLGAPRPPRTETTASAGTASMLGLQIERNAPDLLLTWNRNSAEIVTARRATLNIRDGRVQKIIDLDKAQLADGSFLYTPATDDIQFRLEVYGADDGSVSQSLRVVVPNRAAERDSRVPPAR
ncbi:MAG: hypothetical protein ABSC93_31270 [Bryobacteraceae bacterium]|jgi:hypothetical protein